MKDRAKFSIDEPLVFGIFVRNLKRCVQYQRCEGESSRAFMLCFFSLKWVKAWWNHCCQDTHSTAHVPVVTGIERRPHCKERSIVDLSYFSSFRILLSKSWSTEQLKANEGLKSFPGHWFFLHLCLQEVDRFLIVFVLIWIASTKQVHLVSYSAWEKC